jgi:hypothetical protein
MNMDETPELRGMQVASELVPAASIVGDDEQDTILLRKMLEDAKQYISSFPWCETVLASYFGRGVGGIFAVFFFHNRPSRFDVAPWMWIVVGVIPSAYLPITDCESPAEVFRSYIRGMNRWNEFARKGRNGSPEQGVPPVNVPATPEWAERLNQKLHGLTLVVKPFFEDEGEHRVN